MISGPASTTKVDCCGCFQRKKRGSIALSEVYCRMCKSPSKCLLRAPLGPPESQCCSPNNIATLLNQSEYELGKEKYKQKAKRKKETRTTTEFEFADDAISLNNETFEDRPSSRASLNSTKETTFTENPYINVNGKEELPCVEYKKYSISSKGKGRKDKTEVSKAEGQGAKRETLNNRINLDRNYNKLSLNKIASYCTLPKRKNTNCEQKCRGGISPPKRVTPDGTHIYYWCDLSKKIKSGKGFVEAWYLIQWKIKLKLGTTSLNIKLFAVLLLMLFSSYRIGRWCLQPTLDHERLHPDFPLLEGEQEGAIGTTKRLLDLRDSSLVEHCKRYQNLLLIELPYCTNVNFLQTSWIIGKDPYWHSSTYIPWEIDLWLWVGFSDLCSKNCIFVLISWIWYMFLPILSLDTALSILSFEFCPLNSVFWILSLKFCPLNSSTLLKFYHSPHFFLSSQIGLGSRQNRDLN